MRDLVEHVEFDTIYHEHFCYFSCSSVDALMARHGLHLNDVEYFPDLHGGTLRWHVGRHAARTPWCQQLLDTERETGMTSLGYYEGFAERVRTCQGELRDLLAQLATDGRHVAAYGAAAKGATLLNSTGIGRELVSYVVDRNVHKHGKLMPGCRLPIRPVEVLVDEQPDDVLAPRMELRRRDRRSASRVPGCRRKVLRACPPPAARSRADASQERSNRACKASASRAGAVASRSDTTGGRMGHPIASEGSFHATASSAPGS